MATRVTAATVANVGTSATNWALNVGASIGLTSQALPDGTTGSQVTASSASGANLRVNYNGGVTIDTAAKTIEFEINVISPSATNTEVALNFLLANDAGFTNAFTLKGGGLTVSCNRGWQKFRFGFDDFEVSSGAPVFTSTMNTVRWNFSLVASTVITIGFRNLGYGGWDKPFGVIMFDDQHETVYDVAYPIMSARSMPGTVACIGKYLDETGSHDGVGQCTVTELLTLKDAGWAMVNHTMNHPQGVLTTESISYCRREIEDCATLLNKLKLSKNGSELVFAPPYGEWSDDYLEAARQAGVTFFRGTVCDGTQAGDPPHCPGFLPTTLRPYQCLVVSNITTATIIKDHISRCATAGRCLIILYHYIVTPADTSLKHSVANFTDEMGHAYAKSALINWVTLPEYVYNLVNP